MQQDLLFVCAHFSRLESPKTHDGYIPYKCAREIDYKGNVIKLHQR